MANTKITNPELFNLGDSTSATQLPVMTTTQRIAMNAAPTLNVDYLVVAGGGGGGGNQSATGGGGGAGGLRTSYGSSSGGGSNAENSLTFNLPTSYTITVGDGGTLGSGTTAPTNGGNSSITGSDITNVTSLGGGAADNSTLLPPQTGGSGGGGGNGSYAGASGEPNQGYAGGNSQSGARGAGGGGAANVGANSTNNNGGAGGSGLSVNILSSANANVEGVGEVSGSSVYYAGGGGGGSAASGASSQASGGIGGGGNGEWSNGNNASAGTANTGGGGGGAFTDGAKNGGSGVVILRYVTADVTGYTTTGSTPIEVIENDYTVLVFKTVGTGTITFTSSTPTGTISTGEMIFNSDTDKVEYWDGTKWYGITYEAPAPVPVGGTWDPTNSITSPCYTGSGALNFSNNNRLATETGAGYYVAAYSTVKVGDFWFFGADAGGNTTQFEGNFDAADQVYTPTDPGTYIEIKYLSPDLSVGITKTRICPYSATWYSNTIRWFTWSSSIVRYNDTPFTTAPAIAINDIIGILVDVDTDTVKFYKNNVFVTTQDL
jgi:hypothetical protein